MLGAAEALSYAATFDEITAPQAKAELSELIVAMVLRQTRGKPAATKRGAIALYCTGLSLNAVGRRLGVSAQSVMRWVRDHARDRCPKPGPSGRATVVEIDEVWHFVQKRPASSGFGRRSSAARAA